jgi:outer membrane protein
MKNGVKYLALGLTAFVIGMAMNNFAMSNIPDKIAVVDVQKVVASSKQVQSLKNERERKIKEIKTFVAKAREDVSKEADSVKRKTLEDKYNKELNTKTEAVQKEYAQKLGEIDKNISAVIAKKAQASSFDIVIAKGVVLYGGTDITDEIAKLVK